MHLGDLIDTYQQAHLMGANGEYYVEYRFLFQESANAFCADCAFPSINP